MIPTVIKKEHVLKAIEFIDKNGVPKNRLSKKFFLIYKGRKYPPKYVVSLAYKFVSGRELDPERFSGGIETNTFLRKLGFKIEEITSSKTVVTKTGHGERCYRCKKVVEQMLRKIYGDVLVNYRFGIGPRPEDFIDSQFYPFLRDIFSKLKELRGFTDFIRSDTLPPVDYYVPYPGFIVEFDESQHFTLARKISLERYPEELKLGFDRYKWIELCNIINAKDNDPPYRDEQRAWYDTLRDFLPTVLDLKPTVRLYARDYVWCSLDPNNQKDVETFRWLLESGIRNWEVNIREDDDPFIARIIIIGFWRGDPLEAKNILNKVCEVWPINKRVKILITCGGFIEFGWPKNITRKDIGDNKNPNEKAVEELIRIAEEKLKKVLDDKLMDKLSQFTDYITIGIDSSKEKISTTYNYIGNLHIELVCVIDLKNKEFYWTGKSYPTSKQENGLVRITDLESHFIDLKNVGKVMILGCHDLNLFNNRNLKGTGEWRKSIKFKFRELAKKEKPKVVLHHPHTTESRRVWINGWNGLIREIKSVEIYAGAGRCPHVECEYVLNDILLSTKRGGTLDFIIKR